MCFCFELVSACVTGVGGPALVVLRIARHPSAITLRKL